MIRALVVALVLAAPLDAQDLPFTNHYETQVSHGLVTAAVGAGCGLIDHARACSGGAVGFYVIRELYAHSFYGGKYGAGELNRSEFRCAIWDSRMDMAWPLLAHWVAWDWGKRKEHWPYWLGAAFGIGLIARHTTPGGMYSGLYC